MSIKLQVRYQYRYCIQFLHSLRLPAWIESGTARLGLVALLVVVGFGYIIEVNKLSTSGYTIHRLETHIADVQHETQNLETDVATYQSITSIQQRLSDANMVPVDANFAATQVHARVVAQR